MKKVIVYVLLASVCAFLFMFIFTDGLQSIEELTFVEAEFVDYCPPHSGKYFSGYWMLSDGNKYSLAGIQRKILSKYNTYDLNGKQFIVGISGKSNVYGAYTISYLSINGEEILTVEQSNKSCIWGYIGLISCCDTLALMCNISSIMKYIDSIREKRDRKKRKKKNQLYKERRKIGWNNDNTPNKTDKDKQ